VKPALFGLLCVWRRVHILRQQPVVQVFSYMWWPKLEKAKREKKHLPKEQTLYHLIPDDLPIIPTIQSVCRIIYLSFLDYMEPSYSYRS
jgi:hypothetical protein